jgi:myosin heavy subunit
MSCNPLLEAFGNAKTVKNDNSSRFGKLTTLKINKHTFQIASSSIRSYFLEKSRLPFQNSGEMNFHIFYYFVKGLPSEECAKYHLKNSKGQLMTTESFKCISSKQPQKTTAADHDAFQEVRKAFNLLKFSLDQQEAIWSVIAAILHLSNVEFDHSKYE